MTNRYLDGVRPAPTQGELGVAWSGTFERYAAHLDANLLHLALESLWGFVGVANRHVEATRPWDLAKAARAGDEPAAERLRGVLGDLVEACRVISLAVAPFMPASAAGAAAQLGVEHAYGPDGNGGPPLAELARWGAVPAGGRIGTVTPLFPRLELDEAGGVPSA
jgi:methionyl-tRNA synthetase